ncbi:BLUF domain-containing protein [Salinimicrobium sp. TIG7-5_MAKvit]|uniref:BLUF domain-containing protein n=1 Tax=Salinimicrobium sp. TIG7-5_MAKvit TaxID=3121289 RepID=UPI003C6DBF40
MNYAISYVSTVASGISKNEIENLLKLTSSNNNQVKITGILLYSNGNFFQVLEGEKTMVTDLFEKIQQDKRHYNLIPIFKKEIEGQKFDTYENLFLSLDAAYNREELDYYKSHVEKLDPSIRNSVNYVLENFS